MNLFSKNPMFLIALLLAPVSIFANVIPANPSNYRSLLTGLEPGDILQLSSGIYDRGLAVSNRHGNSSQPIIITGPETGEPAVFTGNEFRNTVQIDDSSYLVLRYITLDGLSLPYVDAVNSRGPTHHITLENLLIINHGGAYVPDTNHQLTNGIATRGPAWDWIIRNNTIIGAGTGMYLGNSTGRDWPFVGGLIEHNLILDSLGYNMQIKHMFSRDYNNGDSIPGMPTEDRKTIIRHNVFSKENNASIGAFWARPNLLVGHWPLTGAGSNDIYEIYGNFIYSNPAEALFQGEGNIALYDNLLVNPSNSAVHIQPHNHKPRTIRVFHNSIVATGTGIRVSGVDIEYDQLVTGNAVFSTTPFILDTQVQQVTNISDTYSSASNYLAAPFGDPDLGTLDIYPASGSSLSGIRIDNSLLQVFNDWNTDFNGVQRLQGFRGAYAAEGLNPGWQLALTIKPETHTASNGAADIIEGPVSQVALEGDPAIFSVIASGKRPLQYQWFRNDDPIVGAISANLSLDAVFFADNGAMYNCRVTNSLGSALSDSATLTVIADETAPVIDGAVAQSPIQVDIVFSEAVTLASAETVENYQIDQGIQVIAASLNPDNKTVQLQVDSLQLDTVYTVTINNIRDRYFNANEIASDSSVQVIFVPVINLDNGLLPLGWIPLTELRWSVFADNGNNALFLNTTLYDALSGNGLGEYILSPDSYEDFTLTVEAKPNEPASNGNADYALVFGFEDGNNYYYMLFNRNASNTELHKVVDGDRVLLDAATTGWLIDDEYHTVAVSVTSSYVEIRFDGNTVIEYTNLSGAIPVGKVGLGSFNDSAYFDDIRITTGMNTINELIFSNAFE